MAAKNIKRGFNFSPELLAAWEEFHAPSKDYSPSAAGAFLLWMVVEPRLREQLRKLAFTPNIKKARIEARKALRSELPAELASQIDFSKSRISITIDDIYL